MNDKLQRFVNAQKNDYPVALAEITEGKKRSHWMWYIFPQITGLGESSTSKYYAIRNIDEAKAYLNHNILGGRLIEISKALLNLSTNDPRPVFGYPDYLKLQSSMTLFSQIENADPVFKQVLDKFFKGESDNNTLKILSEFKV
ncbi:MAG: DUF1810 domain-containing protein [Prevotellaceae bacterium]|jgi:uncharacterized protein (DUF1810 family)|nr:DUF1810 domain-containing protein [Prevotellaceae bacterium]